MPSDFWNNLQAVAALSLWLRIVGAVLASVILYVTVRESTLSKVAKAKADGERDERISIARKETADANERTAIAEKETAALKLEMTRVNSGLASRTITPEQEAAFLSLITYPANDEKAFKIQVVANDQEAASYARQIKALMERAGFAVLEITYNGASADPGIRIVEKNAGPFSRVAGLLADRFDRAGIKYEGRYDTKLNDGEIRLFVGSKPLAW